MIDLRKHEAFGPTEQPSRDAFNALSLSINDVVPVANATERAQLVADLTSSGFPVSASRPLLVLRADASASGEIEVSRDGTTWRTLWSEPERAWASVTAATGFVSECETILQGNRVAVRGHFDGTVAGVLTTDFRLLGTMFTPYAPKTQDVYVAGSYSGAALLQFRINTAGQIAVRSFSAGASYTTSARFSIAGASWDVRP